MSEIRKASFHAKAQSRERTKSPLFKGGVGKADGGLQDVRRSLTFDL